MKTIYAIAGRAGAGKDTTASMLAFLHHGYIVNGDQFKTWENDNLHITDRHIFHFADNLKKVLKIIYGLESFHLTERKYKDELFFNLNTHKFVDPKEVKIKDHIINIDSIYQFGLRRILDNCNMMEYTPLIKIRTLLQYFGTNVCRNLLDEHIWTDNTIHNLDAMLHNVNDVYIADMRFEEEYNRLKKYADENNVKLATIYIERPDNDCTIHVNHESENINIPCKYIIHNTGTLEDLFNYIKEEIYHNENC